MHQLILKVVRQIRRSRDTNAQLMDVQINVYKEECASHMGQRIQGSSVALMDVLIMRRKEDYASSMEQHMKRRNAAVLDVIRMHGMEECALGMGQRSIYAAVMDVIIMCEREDYA